MARNAAGGVKARRPGGYKMYKGPKRVFGKRDPLRDPDNINDEQIARKRTGFTSKLVPKRTI